MHNFVWTGVFIAESNNGRKALLNRYHSQLRQEDSGVGEPNIRMELRAITVTTVATWAHGRACETQAIGDVLLWHPVQNDTPRTAWITP